MTVQGRTGGRVLFEESDHQFGVRLEEKDGQRELIAVGDPDSAISAIAQIGGDWRPDITTMTTEIREALPEDMAQFLGPEWGYRWEFWYADSPLQPVAVTENVVLLTHGSNDLAQYADDIREALAASNPISDANESFDKLSWFVAFAEEGSVGAVMGCETHVVGEQRLAYFHGLGTVPAFRGRGYASTLMVAAVNIALESHDAIYFGMWAWNEGACRIYSRVGLTNGAHLIEGRREPFIELG
ncbi:GNAT family N-acetyltransferase [Arcanobacterium canis]